MKNNKGFTLIELLAVIVILAIIALIATPIVVNLIEDSRKSANENAVNGIVKAAEVCYGRDMMNDAKFGGSEFTCASSGCTNTSYTKDGATGSCSDSSKTTAADCTTASGTWTAYESVCDSGLEFKGTNPTSGNITILEDGKVIIEDLVINNYVCNIINDKITCEN